MEGRTCRDKTYPNVLIYLVANCTIFLGSSLVAQMVKNLPAMWDTQVQSLGLEDSLEKGLVTHSNIVASRTPWTKEPGRL